MKHFSQDGKFIENAHKSVHSFFEIIIYDSFLPFMIGISSIPTGWILLKLPC
jgi:hypothetical protein